MAAKSTDPKMLSYRLRGKYWDGTIIHYVGEIIQFPEGGQPRSAVLVTSAAPAAPVVSAPVGTVAAETEDEE